MASIKRLPKGILEKTASASDLPILLTKKANVNLDNVPDSVFVQKVLHADLTKAIGTATHKLSSYNSLQEFVDYIGSQESTLLIDRSEVIDTNITIPRNVTLLFKKGNILTINPSNQLKILGDIIAGHWQIFNVSNSSDIAGKLVRGKTKAEWFGMLPSNPDNSSFLKLVFEITRNLDCKTVKVSSGKFRFENPVQLTGPGAITIEGTGKIPITHVKNTWPNEQNWKGTIFDFRPAGRLNQDALIVGDDNTQVFEFGLKNLTIIANTEQNNHVVQIQYAPQQTELIDILIVQAGDGNGILISDVWVGFYIRHLWCINVNGYRETIQNSGFILASDRNAGGNIVLIDVNANGFYYGRKFGFFPGEVSSNYSKASRNILMVSSQSQNCGIGMTIGIGISQMKIEADWIEYVRKGGIVINGNASDISIEESRISGYHLEPGGFGVKIGCEPNVECTGSLANRGHVTILNTYIHNLNDNTKGIIKYKWYQDANLYVSNCQIRKRPSADANTVYGIVLYQNSSSKSIVFNQIEFGNSNNNTIKAENRIVYNDNGNFKQLNHKILKHYLPSDHETFGLNYKFRNVNNINENTITNSYKRIDVDFSQYNSKWVSPDTPNFLNVINMNNAHRAIWFSDAHTQKIYIIKRSDNDTNHYLNLRYDTSQGGEVFGRLYAYQKALVYCVNGTWHVEKLDGLYDIDTYRVSDFKSFNDAINTLKTKAFATLIIDRFATAVADITVPENITLLFTNIAKILGTVNVTIKGKIIAPRARIFGVDLNVTILNQIAYPEWFADSDSEMLTKAIENADAISLAPSKIYSLDSQVNVVEGQTIIYGNNALIQPSSTFPDGIFLIKFNADLSGGGYPFKVLVTGLKMNIKKAHGIKIVANSDFKLHDIRITAYESFPNKAIEIINAFNIEIEKCVIKWLNATPANTIAINIIGNESLNTPYKTNLSVNIKNCMFINWDKAVVVDNSNTTVASRNFSIENTSFVSAKTWAIEFNGPIENLNVSSCSFTGCQGVLKVASLGYESNVHVSSCYIVNTKTAFDFTGQGKAYINSCKLLGSVTSTKRKVFDNNTFDTIFTKSNKVLTSSYELKPTNNSGTLKANQNVVKTATSNKILSVIDDGDSIYNNTGASADITLTLPSVTDAGDGYTITFVVTEAFAMTIQPDTNDRIIPVTNVDGTPITSNTIGSVITLVAMRPNLWIATSNNGFA